MSGTSTEPLKRGRGIHAIREALSILLALASTVVAQTPQHCNDQPPSVIPAESDPRRYLDARGEPMVEFTLDMNRHEDRLRVPRRDLDRLPFWTRRSHPRRFFQFLRGS